jgi:hypothetical protein
MRPSSFEVPLPTIAAAVVVTAAEVAAVTFEHFNPQHPLSLPVVVGVSGLVLSMVFFTPRRPPSDRELFEKALLQAADNMLALGQNSRQSA